MILEQLVKKTDKYPLSWSNRMLISTASSLHDIGKIGIDEKILNKPGRLTPEERKIMEKHTVIGADMLANLQMYEDEPLMKVAYQICRWHHERYDGKGYPDGLKGEEIPISAQVVALVVGFLAAFISGYIACSWMLNLVKKGKLIWFAVYCFVVGIIILFVH